MICHCRISSFVVYHVENNLFSRNYLFNIYTEFWIEMTYLLILSAIIYCSWIFSYFLFYNFALQLQYYCHVSPSVSRDQYTALPLVGVLGMWFRRINNIINYIYLKWKIKGANLSYWGSSRILSFSDWMRICWIWFV